MWRLLGKNPDGCGDGPAVDALEVKAQVVRVYDVFGVGHVGLIASTTIIPLQSGVANMSRVCSVLVVGELPQCLELVKALTSDELCLEG